MKQDMSITKKWAKRNVKPSIKRSPIPKGSSEMYRTAHMKEQRSMADDANKASDHNKHMSRRQILNVHNRKARARPWRHQSVPSQYGTWWGHGSVVRGKGGCGFCWDLCPRILLYDAMYYIMYDMMYDLIL